MSGCSVCGKIPRDVIWSRIYSNSYNYDAELWQVSVLLTLSVLVSPYIKNVNILDYKCPSCRQNLPMQDKF